MADEIFHPGEEVIWLKDLGGGIWPVIARVVAVTPRRVTIQANDPDDRGEGLVTRHVSPSRLQLRSPKKAPLRRKSARKPTAAKTQPVVSFETLYPNIAAWVQDGWIEIGHDDCDRPFLRAMDIGGAAWEGEGPYTTLDEALAALDAGIAAWFRDRS